MKIKIVRTHPDGTTDTSVWERSLGKKNCNGVRVADWNDMIGKNRLEIFYGDRKLTETSIEVK